MLGDFTRSLFAAIKKYARVLLQQGRVPLDPDSNEEAKPPSAAETPQPRHECDEQQRVHAADARAACSAMSEQATRLPGVASREAGLEEVAKRMDEPYKPGEHGWITVRHRS